MLDLGWTELLVIGIVALIVVGPKDLPVMFHSLGKFTARMRSMARDFSRAMDDAARESGARDVARDLRNMSNPTAAGKSAFKSAVGLDDPFGDDDEDKPDAQKPDEKPAHGPNTAALAETRAAEAKARREEAAARANARSASFQGFEGQGFEGGAQGGTPAPAPGEDAPAPDRGHESPAEPSDEPRQAAGDKA
jgi:sec-independent protein translocase protein TatB